MATLPRSQETDAEASPGTEAPLPAPAWDGRQRLLRPAEPTFLLSMRVVLRLTGMGLCISRTSKTTVYAGWAQTASLRPSREMARRLKAETAARLPPRECQDPIRSRSILQG